MDGPSIPVGRCEYRRPAQNWLDKYDILFSVIDTEWSYNSYQEVYSLPWTCESCHIIACLSPLERIQHTKFTCSSRTQENLPEVSSAPKDNRPNAKEYKCETCEQNLYMTPVEILRHKKSCKGK